MSRAQVQSRWAASTPTRRPSASRTGADDVEEAQGLARVRLARIRAAGDLSAEDSPAGGQRRLQEFGRMHVPHEGRGARRAEIVPAGDVRALQRAGAGHRHAPVRVDQPDDRVGRVGRLHPLHQGALGGRAGPGIAQAVRGGGDLDVAPALEHADVEAPRHLAGDLGELAADLRLEPAGRLAAHQGGERQGGQDAEGAETQRQHGAQRRRRPAGGAARPGPRDRPARRPKRIAAADPEGDSEGATACIRSPADPGRLRRRRSRPPSLLGAASQGSYSARARGLSKTVSSLRRRAITIESCKYGTRSPRRRRRQKPGQAPGIVPP